MLQQRRSRDNCSDKNNGPRVTRGFHDPMPPNGTTAGPLRINMLLARCLQNEHWKPTVNDTTTTKVRQAVSLKILENVFRQPGGTAGAM
jgi:hypothetical protein